MARVTVEDCLRQVENRFALVHLAVRRVLQLRKGATPLIDAPKNKEVVVALREIAAGKVRPDNILELERIDEYLEGPEGSDSAEKTPEAGPAQKEAEEASEDKGASEPKESQQ